MTLTPEEVQKLYKLLLNQWISYEDKETIELVRRIARIARGEEDASSGN